MGTQYTSAEAALALAVRLRSKRKIRRRPKGVCKNSPHTAKECAQEQVPWCHTQVPQGSTTKGQHCKASSLVTKCRKQAEQCIQANISLSKVRVDCIYTAKFLGGPLGCSCAQNMRGPTTAHTRVWTRAQSTVPIEASCQAEVLPVLLLAASEWAVWLLEPSGARKTVNDFVFGSARPARALFCALCSSLRSFALLASKYRLAQAHAVTQNHVK